MIELGAPVLGEAEKQALVAVLDDQWLTMGARVRAFERAFAELHGVEDAVAVSSATAALQLILAAFDVGAGDEVLVPSMSFVATTAAVVHAGATPVFVDIESPDRPHMSLDEARRSITPRTRAVMVMHYGGFAVDLPAWRGLADEHGLLLFEDAAHASGLGGVTGVGTDAAAYSGHDIEVDRDVQPLCAHWYLDLIGNRLITEGREGHRLHGYLPKGDT